VRYRTESGLGREENEGRHIAEHHIIHVEPPMENSSDKQADELKDNEAVDQPGDQQAGRAEDESSEKIPASKETHGNRVEERIENRASKNQETREEAKSIAGTEPHHDPRNESPDSGPAPLDRY
jgi:hypothetical protein